MQFITWNDRKLYEYVDKIDQSQQTSGTTRATDEGTSRISTELTQEQWTLLQERRERPSAHSPSSLSMPTTTHGRVAVSTKPPPRTTR